MKAVRCCHCQSVELHGRQRCQGKLIVKADTAAERWENCLHWLEPEKCCRPMWVAMEEVFETCSDCGKKWISYRLRVRTLEKMLPRYHRPRYRLCSNCIAGRLKPVDESGVRWVAPWVRQQ